MGAATFLETYAHMLSGADMVAHCAAKHSAAQYAAWLADSACSVWIAETSVRAPAGYLVLTPPTLPPGEADPRDLEVMRIYVLSRYHGSGLGHALMQHALGHARQAGKRRLVLGMHKQNHQALRFYERQGFSIVGTRDFQVGAQLCADWVLARTV